MKQYLEETKLLDFIEPSIQNLITHRNWKQLEEKECIAAVYDFVRNEIKFGYNRRDELPASEILRDGYGQCNTKAILIMALFRALHIPCRIHGFFIDKNMQKGALTGIAFLFSPQRLVHTWTEVYVDKQWVDLEGIILDDSYLDQVKTRLCGTNQCYSGYGVSVKSKEAINVSFQGQSTYIQSASITEDLGIFDNPDTFFNHYNNMDNKIKSLMFDVLRKRINKKLDRVRQGR